MISSQAEEMNVSWGVEKEFNRATYKPIGFTSGPKAQQSSGISQRGSLLGLYPITAPSSDGQGSELCCRQRSGALNSTDHRGAEFVCFSTN